MGNLPCVSIYSGPGSDYGVNERLVSLQDLYSYVQLSFTFIFAPFSGILFLPLGTWRLRTRTSGRFNLFPSDPFHGDFNLSLAP